MSHIEIIAGVGAGKTSLGKALQQQDFVFIPEEFENNPFLIPFHQDPWSCAFEFGMTMLALHYHQLHKEEIKSPYTVFDFSLITNEAYARSYADFELMKPSLSGSYIEAAHTARHEARKPSLRILLELPAAIQMERIRQRGRELEKEDRTSQAFIETLNNHIAHIIAGLDDHVPLLRVDAAAYNWVKNSDDGKIVADLVTQALKP